MATTRSKLRAAQRPDTEVRFSVRGRGAFPYDMLRYDRCWPSSEHDSYEAAAHPRERTVYLTGISASAPTAARWASFGWEVQA